MLKYIFFLVYLAVHMGNAHPDHNRGRVTRLLVRQNTATTTAFKPSASGSLSGTCRSNDMATCGGLCVDVKNGETCCDPRANYACISGSYCLFNGLCCPNELDPETCASNSGLKLPASFSRPSKYPSSTQASSTRLSSSSNTSRTSSSVESRTSSSIASRTSSSIASRTSSSIASRTSSSTAGQKSSSIASRTSSSTANQKSSPAASAKPSSSAIKALSTRPSNTGPPPSSYPTVNEDSVAPKEAAPVTTTYGPITATINNSPVTLSYSGEVLPLQTVANHKPAPSNFKEAVLAALAKDPETAAFGDLLRQAPSVFEGLEEKKEYYVFAPTTKFVVDFLKHLQDRPRRRARSDVYVDPNTSQQFSEKPKGAPDIERVSSTLKTTLVGETKYVDLGAGEGARVVSNPASGGNGTVNIISGFGNSTLVHAGQVPFEGGVIKKCDGFFTLPQSLETVFANTSGRLWSTALQKENLLAELSQKRMVTIFAVPDFAIDEANLPGSADLNRLIYDGLVYTPDMSDTRCLTTRGGGSVRITRNGADILINGARITTANVISKNGVIHYLETIPTAEQCSSSDPGVGGQSVKKSAGSAVVASRMAVLGLSIASLVAYLWM